MSRWQGAVIRPLTSLTLLAGLTYLTWRWGFSINWHNWWIGVPLVLAETYTFIDAALFGLTVWRIKIRGEAPPPDPEATVDVLITTYDEPIELVMATAAAAERIRFPHTTWILDDGDRPELAAAAGQLGVGYINRGDDWVERPRHAKAGNLNNALFETYGEFLLILDADQVPDPAILDRTLGWFTDPAVALVQTPQWFSNVPDSDPLGSQAPLFYGPIQQGKDGWNAAFFCGSNAVLRREALMQLGIVGYVRAVEDALRDVLDASGRILSNAVRQLPVEAESARMAVASVREASIAARVRLDAGTPASEVTYNFQQAVGRASRSIVGRDFAQIQADLAELDEIDSGPLPVEFDEQIGLTVIDSEALTRLSERDWSPLGALDSVTELVRATDVDRGHEAQPVMPLATLSVTEDMATCMRLHAMGWKSVFHQETLAHGLAPNDLGAMMQQRLRWAQGTLQVMLKENPLAQPGLTWGQRLMYFGTMWSYLSGFASVVFLLCPVLYLCFAILPVATYGSDFLGFFLPYFLLNQVLFLAVGYGVKTWRGLQYNLTLFPVWIRACVTAAANVIAGRKLGFIVTPKTADAGPKQFPWRLVWPQLTAMALLVIALAAGAARLALRDSLSGIGYGLNALWIVYDLTVMSVIIKAARYRVPEPDGVHAA